MHNLTVALSVKVSEISIRPATAIVENAQEYFFVQKRICAILMYMLIIMYLYLL